MAVLGAAAGLWAHARVGHADAASRCATAGGKGCGGGGGGGRWPAVDDRGRAGAVGVWAKVQWLELYNELTVRHCVKVVRALICVDERLGGLKICRPQHHFLRHSLKESPIVVNESKALASGGAARGRGGQPNLPQKRLDDALAPHTSKG